MKVTEIIHYQVNSFLKAGKTIRSPKDDKEKRLSRAVGLFLLLISAGIYMLIFSLDFLPLRIHIRAVLIISPLIALAIKFYKGISMSWIIDGLKKYWLIPSLILYMYIVVALMIYAVFIPESFFLFSYAGGLMMLAMGFIISVYCRAESSSILYDINNQRISFAELDTDGKIKFFMLQLFAILFIAVFIGGLAMLAWESGLADWFFQELLGW